MRFRTDHMTAAEEHARVLAGKSRIPCTCDDLDCASRPEVYEKVEPARPGDMWTCMFSDRGQAGYWLCCPKCGDLHAVTSASNCTEKGTFGGYVMCRHQHERISCWTWSGSAENNTLTAHPSIHFVGECGWHGWLENGAFREA